MTDRPADHVPVHERVPTAYAERLAICLEAGVSRDRAETLARCEGWAARDRAHRRAVHCLCGAHRTRAAAPPRDVPSEAASRCQEARGGRGR
jgi:ferric-dicitrate binding protein FerR (iron transport regulator)